MYRMRPSLYTLVGSCEVNVFRYYRGYARRPVRVHNPVIKDESFTDKTFTKVTLNNKFKTNTLSNNKVNGKDGRQQPESSQSAGSTPQEDYQVHTTTAYNSQHKTNNLVNEVQFKHLKDAKDFVRSLLNNISSRKFREENKFFVGEGHRIIKEALDAGVTPEAIYFSRDHHLPLLKSGSANFGLEELNALNDLPLYKTPYKRLQTLSSLTTCPGMLGVFKRPESGSSQVASQSVPVTVIVDEVREPGNLGGILRTLAAVGVARVILMKGCCDPWESKVLRAACGAHFRIKLKVKVTWGVVQNYVPEYAPLLLADVCRKIDLDGCVKENIQVLHSPKVKPVTKNITSLYNDSDTVNVYEINSEGKKIVTDPSYDDEDHLSHFDNVHLPVHYYDDVQILQKISNISPEVVIIIGGETGISKAARKFACFNGGVQVAVPLANGMDSLNASVAVGIILYEIQRQFCRLPLRSLSSETSS